MSLVSYLSGVWHTLFQRLFNGDQVKKQQIYKVTPDDESRG